MRLIVPQINTGAYAARLLKKRLKDSKKFVLGLPTGGTAVDMYSAFREEYSKGNLSFKNVVTFNMDEYFGLPASHPQSYISFMKRHLFDHVDIKPENINIPDGNAKDIEKECFAYEEKIKNAGGIDLFFGGVGENGHIAFNEPFSSLQSQTHKVFLTQCTIKANSRFFNSEEETPKTAITVGVGTIMSAREVVILATGFKKAEAVRAALEGAVSSKWVISALQLHKKAVIVADSAACANLEPATFEYFKNLKDEYSELENIN
ncbi:Glucosamine-6-phosphate deaminase [Elusimicrobium minutum Pei191]|uniref:Glucosamine-6-phosphate deaminase n=1 Tax=Elusimicrobium minutum (strain Pei191) TaxID=445932 RepID=B2KEF2_ELUMP|nr:glucosamine-6-phosphate deaminase [Elusimicrobium minutum]ACC98898.1 Glucosamine-6-phosphate deaminase [Elusimicrobium minutum Pei191]